MSFGSNVMPRRFGAGKPKPKPKPVTISDPAPGAGIRPPLSVAARAEQRRRP